MRYFAVVSYRGTLYCGWQKQTVSKLPSVETTIEAVLSRILSSGIKIYGSGRTDAGVHALGQTFHFDTEKEIEPQKLMHSLNELLPKDIRILDLKTVDENFHARFSAVSKTYIYKIRNAKTSSAFHSDLEWTLGQPLNIEKMREAAEIFKGEHNFQNFTSKEEDEQKFSRNIGVFDIKCENSSIEITISGNGFMRYMVRMLVGSIVQVGLGKMSTKDLQDELESPIRKPSSHKAPAYGLYLKEVNYKN